MSAVAARAVAPAGSMIVLLGDLPVAWQEVPESHVGIVQPGNDELKPFEPRSPRPAP